MPLSGEAQAGTIIGSDRRIHPLTHLAIDGRPLALRPHTPAALHLQEWIAALVARGLRLTVLHPEGLRPALPLEVESHPVGDHTSTWSRLCYEQAGQPQAARRLGCDLLLVFEGGAPIAARTPVAALPSGRSSGVRGGPLKTLQRAAGQAGRSVARWILYPSDVPSYREGHRRAQAFPAFVDPGLLDAEPAAMPEHVLCYGLRRHQVALALAAWSWVDGSLGDTYPLLFLGLDAELEHYIRLVADELDVAESIAFHPQIELDALPGFYARAAAYLGIGVHAWGQPLRWALAAGVPVAAEDSPAAASILGAAGYLAPAGDARALGAACLSLLVQEELADQLRERGREIAQRYAGRSPHQAMLEAVRAD